jgi:succinate dehydrogenase hydrophobic anchor subunit
MMRTRVVPQRGFNLDYIMFIFTRVSGLSIVLLALIGIILAMVMGARTQMDLGTLMRWTFFPNPNHVVNSDIPDVTLGWANAYWSTMQFLLIFFAFTHAANGLRMIVEDYVNRGVGQLLVRGFFFLLWLFMLITAIFVVLSS